MFYNYLLNKRHFCPMKLIDIEQVNSFKFDFELYWCAKVQGLTEFRKSKMSQSQMAMLTGRSLKTIQRFENYQSNDPELMFLYNRICQPPDISIKTNDID